MATFDWDGNRKPGRSPFATYTDSPAYNIQSRSLGNEAKGSNIPFSDILGDKLMKNSSGTLYNQSYAATKVLLNYYCLYEFTYLGYNLWSLTGECDTFNDNNNLL